MRLTSLSVVLAFGLLTSQSGYAQQAKTAAQCSADYAANKAAIRGAKIRKKDFIASCRAGNETIPESAAAASPVAPAAAPPSTSLLPFHRRAVAPAPAPVTSAAPSGENQFASPAQAQGRCPGATVVWVNTASGVYHFAGSRSYGRTKAGAYMCESDATAAGDRASKTEKRP